MNCSDVEILLDDYVDGELAPRERGDLESHLGACPDCRGALAELRGLQQAVAALPRELTPAHDLLPRIREASTRSVSSSGTVPWGFRWAAAAAAVALLAAAGWLGLRGPGGGAGDVPRPGSPAGALPAAELTLAEFEAAELEYERATTRLLEILETRQDDLSPATQRVVRENLKIIDRAIVEVRAALEADPTDARNGHALNALHRQKVELLWRISRVSS